MFDDVPAAGITGAITAYVALNVPAIASEDEPTVRASYLMMDVVARYALLPLGGAALATGIIQALGTSWGMFRHYWVLASLSLTSVAFAVLVLHLGVVERNAAVAADPHGDVAQLGGDLVHSVGGLLVLLVVLILNIYKPRGLTRHGWRRQRGH